MGDIKEVLEDSKFGVPQGAVIFPILLNMVMFQISYRLGTIKGLHYTIYPGDVSLWTFEGSMSEQGSILQRAMDTLKAFLKEVGM